MSDLAAAAISWKRRRSLRSLTLLLGFNLLQSWKKEKLRRQ